LPNVEFSRDILAEPAKRLLVRRDSGHTSGRST
jgi:hypothetical protein